MGPWVLINARWYKLTQAAGGKSSLPALAGVVGFEARLIVLADLQP